MNIFHFYDFLTISGPIDLYTILPCSSGTLYCISDLWPKSEGGVDVNDRYTELSSHEALFESLQRPLETLSNRQKPIQNDVF